MERLTHFDGTSYQPLSSKVECVQKLGVLEDAEEQKRLVILPCEIGTSIFRIYNTRGCENCTKKNTTCNGNECPNPKYYECQFSYKHLDVLEDIYLTREEVEVALKN